LVGGAIARRLAEEDCEVVTVSHGDLDLRRQAEVETWFARARPDAAIVAAATVGGILANRTRPGEFIYDNLMIEANIVETARRTRLERLLFLGSACIYPREAPQPMAEDALLTGPLEPTNQWYAIAKIAGIKMCQAYRTQYGCDFIAAQPNNLYGPGDNFDLESSHVIPALMAKAHAAKQAGARAMEVWGSGTPRREFLYVDDLADAAVFLLRHYGGDAPINIGTGEELTIAELAQTVARVVGFKGSLEFDRSKPDGAPRKLLDVSLMRSLGWHATTPLAEGLAATYAWYLDHVA
jgi:GDP-L-fucose synthase